MTGSLPKVNRFFPSVGSVLTASLVKSTDYFSSNSIDNRDDNGSVGHGSRVKWVNKSEWVTLVTGQYS